MAELKMPLQARLKDGRTATINFLSEKDGARELQGFINALVRENTFIVYDRPTSLKDEIRWKTEKLSDFRKGLGHLLVARVGGKLAGTSEARRERAKGRHNISLGIALGREYRGVGLGEVLLRANIELAGKRLKPRNIYLSVLASNKPARSLYRKLGFREFAVFPKWMLHKGRYVDHIFMKL